MTGTTDATTAITRYDPPGYMTDFDGIPGQLDAWSAAVSGWFDEAVKSEAEVLQGQPCQYYNQLTTPTVGAAVAQEIVWNGFPGTLRNRWGRREALVRADGFLPLTERMDGPGSYYKGAVWESLYYRPQDEYCEWHVDRDAQGRITRVTFTSEPPEYWQALHGDTLASLLTGDFIYPTVGDPQLMLDLYRELVSPEVAYEDLVCAADLVSGGQVIYQKGAYNPYNKWNTTHGIVHLTQPANSLGAEIKLGADGTVLRTAGAFGGPVLSDPDALIACAQYGGLNRCSDPTIGASVNELAALGFAVTLRNPVGLYMDHLDLTGWEAPDGSPVTADFFRVLRGQPGLIERAVFEVPPGEGFTVSDITIAGVPIAYGGQLAEQITMKIVGLASEPGKFANKAVPGANGACAYVDNPNFLHYPGADGVCPAGTVPVFTGAAAPPPAPAAPVAAAATAASPLHRRLPHRSR